MDKDKRIRQLEKRVKELELLLKKDTTMKKGIMVIADSMHAQRFNNHQVVIEV